MKILQEWLWSINYTLLEEILFEAIKRASCPLHFINLLLPLILVSNIERNIRSFFIHS